MWMGKTGNQYTETLLERCAMSLAKMKEERNLARSAEKGGSAAPQDTAKDKSIEIDYISVKFSFLQRRRISGAQAHQFTTKSKEVLRTVGMRVIGRQEIHMELTTVISLLFVIKRFS